MRMSLATLLIGGLCIALAAAILAYAVFVPAGSPADEKPTLRVGGETVRVTVMDTPKERAQGLSGREGLEKDEGMLFVFPEDGTHGFWMKDMLFSIDILWLSESGEVVDLYTHVSPSTYPRVFEPKRTARYVLELPAGFAEAHGVEEGSKITFPSQP